MSSLLGPYQASDGLARPLEAVGPLVVFRRKAARFCSKLQKVSLWTSSDTQEPYGSLNSFIDPDVPYKGAQTGHSKPRKSCKPKKPMVPTKIKERKVAKNNCPQQGQVPLRRPCQTAPDFN
jgi:hypothetical protein